MIELLVPDCAAPEEMLTMTLSPDSRSNGTKARIFANGRIIHSLAVNIF